MTDPTTPPWMRKPEPPQPGAYPPPGYGQAGYGQVGYGQQPYGAPMPYGYAPQYGPPIHPDAIGKPVGWFIVNWLFFWPTAIYSLVKHWTPIDRCLYTGDLHAARDHCEAVRRLGIWSLIINVVWVVFVIIVFGLAVSFSANGS